MKSRQILFVEPNVAALVDNEVPDVPAQREVLVRTEYTAVSAGTERANLIGEIQVSGGEVLERAVFPRAFGYSGAGVVEKVGSLVKSVAPGDRVVIYFGKHQQYNCIDESQVFRIDSASVPQAEAALVVIAGFSLAGVRKTRLEAGESALVAGLGILGLFAVAILRAAGACPIVASDPNPERRAIAAALGADCTLDPLAAGYAERVREITSGKGIDAAIEVTGVPEALVQTLDCMARFGRVALLGCTRNPAGMIDFYHQVHYPGVTIVGANNFARPRYESSPGNWTARDDCEALLRLRAGGRLSFAPLISEIRAPEDAPDVYRRLAFDYGNFPIGVLFDWTGTK